MKNRGPVFRIVLSITAAAMTFFGMPTLAGPAAAPAAIAGTVSAEATPLAGARIHLVDATDADRSFSTGETDEQGRFALDLPAADYRVAIETGDGLYVVPTTVRLDSGRSQRMHLTVGESTQAMKAGASTAKAAMGWNNPLVATLLVLGSATVIGFVVDDLTDDENAPATASPMS